MKKLIALIALLILPLLVPGFAMAQTTSGSPAARRKATPKRKASGKKKKAKKKASRKQSGFIAWLNSWGDWMYDVYMAKLDSKHGLTPKKRILGFAGAIALAAALMYLLVLLMEFASLFSHLSKKNGKLWDLFSLLAVPFGLAAIVVGLVEILFLCAFLMEVGWPPGWLNGLGATMRLVATGLGYYIGHATVPKGKDLAA